MLNSAYFSLKFLDTRHQFALPKHHFRGILCTSRAALQGDFHPVLEQFNPSWALLQLAVISPIGLARDRSQKMLASDSPTSPFQFCLGTIRQVDFSAKKIHRPLFREFLQGFLNSPQGGDFEQAAVTDCIVAKELVQGHGVDLRSSKDLVGGCHAGVDGCPSTIPVAGIQYPFATISRNGLVDYRHVRDPIEFSD
jgi:hypothetical protein